MEIAEIIIFDTISLAAMFGLSEALGRWLERHTKPVKPVNLRPFSDIRF
jgi:hypothetical protein